MFLVVGEFTTQPPPSFCAKSVGGETRQVFLSASGHAQDSEQSKPVSQFCLRTSCKPTVCVCSHLFQHLSHTNKHTIVCLPDTPMMFDDSCTFTAHR